MEPAHAGDSGPVGAGWERPRLVRRLLSRRAFVIAGAGSGKSALLAQAAAAEPRSILVRLSPAHATPTSLAAELEVVRATASARATEVVLLDDAQWCAGGEAGAVLEQYLLDAPQRVVVASREPLAAAAPRAEYGGATTVGVRDLALRLDEVGGAFLACGAAPPPLEVASRLLAETAGWPALVGLIADAVAGSDHDGVGAAIAVAVAGDTAAPLLDALLDELEPALQQAIRDASVLAVLRPGTVTDLLGPAAAAHLLRALDDGALPHRLRADGGRELPRMLRRHVLDRTTAAHRQTLAKSAAAVCSARDAHRLLAEAGMHDALLARLRDEVEAMTTPGSAAWAGSLPVWRDDAVAVIAQARALLDDRSPAAAHRRLAGLDAVPQPPSVAHALRGLRREAEGDLEAAASVVDESPRTDGLGADGSRRAAAPGAPGTPGALVDARDADADRSPAQRVRSAVHRLLAGDAVGAVRVLRSVARDPGAAAPVALSARLATVVAQSAVADPADTVTAACQVEADAESLGCTGLARLARGVLAALGGGAPRAVREVVEACEARGDHAGAALVEATGLLGRLRDGRADARSAGRLADRLAALGWVDAASFARCTAAYLAATHGSPTAAAAIAGAASTRAVARSEASRAWLDAARSRLATRARDRAELLTRARHAALAAGMPRLPVRLPAVPAEPAATTGPPMSTLTTARGAVARRPELDRVSSAATGPLSFNTTERMPRVAVGCFGGFRLTVEGRELDLRGVRPQARSVLRILALNVGAPVHRELIADLIWGDLGPTSAMHALHVSISSLRRALGQGTADRIVERDGEAYLLRLADRRDCDLADFDASLEDAANSRRRGDAAGTASGLRHAVHRYVGEILPEDGPAEWAVGARERYRTRASEAAAALAHLELRTGDRQGALDAAARAVEIDPWLDESWRALVTVHRESGDVVATRRAEEGYRRMRQTLGVE
ncbi:BTAD domain-containing putative transcriptional regulator [Agromyces sp. MMS24-K17]|uniref:BTAD domain-containing putative transcriptional regulator n=1 Tax=Agromyces sp. MMS24-K17 TaxID=3372850 RepID=UPI0037548AD4